MAQLSVCFTLGKTMLAARGMASRLAGAAKGFAAVAVSTPRVHLSLSQSFNVLALHYIPGHPANQGVKVSNVCGWCFSRHHSFFGHENSPPCALTHIHTPSSLLHDSCRFRTRPDRRSFR